MAWSLYRNKVFCRHLGTFNKNFISLQAPNLDLMKEKQDYKYVLPRVINSVVSSPTIKVPEVKHWIRELLEYLLPKEKQNKGVAVSIGYQMMENSENITEESLHSARVLGWCIELAYFVLLDDIIDQSTQRYGKPCWHQLPNVGINAINDGIIMHLALEDVLHRNFSGTPMYKEILQVFHEATMLVSIGERLETHVPYKNIKEFEHFTWKYYHVTSTHKAEFYTFKLTVHLAMLMLKNSDIKMNEELSGICSELGKLAVIRNDYVDVYGRDYNTEKFGTDIRQGKISWLAVAALERCNDAQKDLFKKYYGTKELEHVKHVKQLYDELQIPVVYEQREVAMQEDLLKRINLLPSEKTKAFLKFVTEFYN